MTKFVNWACAWPLKSKKALSIVKKIIGITLIALLLGTNTYARAIDNDNDKLTKSGAKKDSTDSVANTEYAFKNLFTSNNYNPSTPYATQLRPEAVAFVQDYISKQGKELLSMKGWALPYFRVMDGILLAYGIPREMKYLAVIESHLNPNDISWAGAVGPWQLMPETGRLMGLRVNGYVDERRNYVLSTQAAARYLSQLYAQLGDWLLVVAAYNGGPGRVLSAIRKSGTKDFWKLQNYLPLESRNHVKKFIGTHYVMEGNGGVTTSTTADWDAHQANTMAEITQLQSPGKLTDEEAATTKVLNIHGKYNSVVMAKDLTMDIAQFNKLNPNFDGLADGNDGYNLRLPQDKMDLFNANRYIILHECILNILQSQTLTEYPSESRLAKPIGKVKSKK